MHAAKRIGACIEIFRKINVSIQAQQMALFLAVAAKADVTMNELSEIVGISSSSISRNVMAMGKVDRKGRPGPG